MSGTVATRPKGLKVFAAALRTRKSASMLVFGFSSGLPSTLIATLAVWLGDFKITMATIGVLSWVGLAFAFKFLWSPVVDRLRLPGVGRLGRRKGWIIPCQVIIVMSLVSMALTDPVTQLGYFAIFAFLAALATATQDIAIDAWRIDVADEQTPVEVLSPVYQLGSRFAALVGGAFALMLAARMPWSTVYLLMGGLMAVVLAVSLFAPDTDRPPNAGVHEALARPGELSATARALSLLVVGACWVWAIVSIVLFMVGMLGAAHPGQKRPSALEFLSHSGPLIVAATVIVPLIVAAVVNWMKLRKVGVQRQQLPATPSRVRTIANYLYTALIAPLADLVERLGWSVLIVIGLILTYTLCYNLWANFAQLFYLNELHYTKDEVAFASKVFGIIMTIVGISLGGYLFVKIGRFPTILLGAALPILGNFLYADLAEGGAGLDALAHFFRLDVVAHWFGGDARMVRLMLAISGENISTGIAGAAFVAYLSGIVSKRFSAVQYALLSSLTFLIGSLGRGVVGQMLDQKVPYAVIFRDLSVAGLFAIAFVLVEWWRSSRAARTAEPGHTGQSA
jgi:PAT family beta-lactamase induction signal transducer AmpG